MTFLFGSKVIADRKFIVQEGCYFPQASSLRFTEFGLCWVSLYCWSFRSVYTIRFRSLPPSSPKSHPRRKASGKSCRGLGAGALRAALMGAGFPCAQGIGLWAHMLSVMIWLLLLYLALWLLTAFGSVHWYQLWASASVNAVCNKVSSVRRQAPCRPRNPGVSWALIPLQGEGPSHPPYSSPGLLVTIFS